MSDEYRFEKAKKCYLLVVSQFVRLYGNSEPITVSALVFFMKPRLGKAIKIVWRKNRIWPKKESVNKFR